MQKELLLLTVIYKWPLGRWSLPSFRPSSTRLPLPSSLWPCTSFRASASSSVKRDSERGWVEQQDRSGSAETLGHLPFLVPQTFSLLGAGSGCPLPGPWALPNLPADNGLRALRGAVLATSVWNGQWSPWDPISAEGRVGGLCELGVL